MPWEQQIRNAAWWVRWYCRPHQSEQRDQAVRRLGATAREAFNRAEEVEPLLRAIAETWPRA